MLTGVIKWHWGDTCIKRVKLKVIKIRKGCQYVGYCGRGPSPIRYDTAPLFVYTDQILRHCVFICSNVHYLLVGLVQWLLVVLLLVGCVIWNNYPLSHYCYYSENLNWAAQNLRLGRGLDIAGLDGSPCGLWATSILWPCQINWNP